MERDPQPDDFIGKTITAVDTSACNVWRFRFTDGSAIAIKAEVMDTRYGGVPVMQVCSECRK